MKLDRIDEELRKGARNGHAKQSGVARYLIESEHLTMLQIAARLGVSKHTLQKRFARAKAMPGPVTWARLA
jgi:AraC-like DNA-binding protein